MCNLPFSQQSESESSALDRTVIIVSPYFPPSTLAGVHRARHLAKHLPAAGWWPIVLCVDDAFHEERLDPGLAALVPASVEIVKTTAVSASFTRPIGLGEISLRAWRPLWRTLQHLLETRPIKAVLITGSPYYPMLFAARIKRQYGVPVVLDFQDPWVSAYAATRTRWSKDGISHRLAVALEPRAVRAADMITSVSQTQNDEMAARYPWLATSIMAAIPIGGDPDDFDALRAHPPAHRQVKLDPAMINLSYVGTFLPRAEPLARTLFKALARLRESKPELAARLRFHFVGTSNQPNGHGLFRISPIATEAGVGDLVVETPQRVPFLEALSLLANSDGLLLIGSDEPHYTASKIYPALMSSRPFLSLFHRASSAHAILSAAGGGICHSFETPAELAALESVLVMSLRELASAPQSLVPRNQAAYAPFEARETARAFATLFDKLALNG
jgi:glycosyltransferase involved in cell wall biosynthesis